MPLFAMTPDTAELSLFVLPLSLYHRTEQGEQLLSCKPEMIGHWRHTQPLRHVKMSCVQVVPVMVLIHPAQYGQSCLLSHAF